MQQVFEPFCATQWQVPTIFLVGGLGFSGLTTAWMVTEDT